ncbi:MAG: hypothetical protein EXR94_02710 [Gemmatimonadetes bacterium]|nr:hypothetical protein [Gemmatimonadota bacterium]
MNFLSQKTIPAATKMRSKGPLLALLVIGWIQSSSAQIVGPSTGGTAGVAQAVRMLGHTKRVLMIAAHPDDEDTELLTYLVRREGAVAAYLSLTRGEGGQNLIGPELGEALGLLRSEELLAARGLDGARQYFTRAFDFGYSKTLGEALTFWPRDSLLKDVVRIVRRFRPQIMVSIFSGTQRDGHGQHQAAGWAAQEAFRAAADPTWFPELEHEGLRPWRPLKLYRSARFDTTGTALMLEGGTLDPEVGQSVHQIAMRGRSLHRSQDMGVLQEVGPSPIRLALVEDRTKTGPELFAGIDTLPPRSGTQESRELEPFAAVAAAANAGVVVDAIAEESRLVGGQSVRLRLSTWNAGTRPVRVRSGLRAPAGWLATGPCLGAEQAILPGQVSHCSIDLVVGLGTPPTAPYFLREARLGAWHRWAGPATGFGDPFDPPDLVGQFDLVLEDGRQITLRREVFHRFRDQAIGEVRRPIGVVPRVDVQVAPSIKVWPVDRIGPQALTVALHHAGADSTFGTVALDLPLGWPPVEPQSFSLVHPEERRTYTFLLKAPSSLEPGDYVVRAVVRDQAGNRYEEGAVSVTYPHIRARSFQVAAIVTIRVKALSLPADRLIGYVLGAADKVPEALRSAGVGVEILDAAALEQGDLSRFRTIVVGSRAYEIDPALVLNNGRLLDYVRLGGHLIVQYQQHAFFSGGYAPYPMTVALQHDRVTDERAPVRVLVPADPIFRGPNRLGPADWDGWVQERGLYFPRTWDARYQSLIETGDPGEVPLRGGLLVAQVGKGTYVYSGLAFFRQLTAGVSGALRLFLNLVAVESRAAVP